MNKIGKALFSLLLSTVSLYAQNDFFIIRDIVTVGNEKTDNKLILREMTVQRGDTLWFSELADVLKTNRNNLLNMRLFSAVSLNIKRVQSQGALCDLVVQLRELWYLIPVPVFELADRNFSDWWIDQGRSLDRVNYGLRLYHNNLTGSADRLKLAAQSGYTRKYELVYSHPYINRTNTLGLRLGLLYASQKEVAYTTQKNKRVFGRIEQQTLLTRWVARLSLYHRNRWYATHRIQLDYDYHRIHPDLSDRLNASFFLSESTIQAYPSLSYRFDWDRRDRVRYALEGTKFSIRLRARGLGLSSAINTLSTWVQYEHYKKLAPQWSTAFQVHARKEWLGHQPPYYQNTALGYGDLFVRGYALYVMDGQSFLLSKSSLRYRLYKHIVPLNDKMPVRQLKKMPVELYVDVHLDGGYVQDRYYDENNPLVNSLQYGYGLGIDIVLYNHYLLEFDLSRNKLGEIGVFFQYNLDF